MLADFFSRGAASSRPPRVPRSRDARQRTGSAGRGDVALGMHRVGRLGWRDESRPSDRALCRLTYCTRRS